MTMKHPLGLLMILLCATSAAAQGIKTSLTIGGLVSIQPAGTGSSIYLSGFGGNAKGAMAAVSTVRSDGFTFSLECTTTTPISAFQDGRLVDGPIPLETRHRDTLLSVLPGFVILNDGTNSVNLKGGLSLVHGSTSRGGEKWNDNRVGLTGGIEFVFKAGRAALVPAASYTFVDRGDENYLLEAGSHLVRISLGVRFGLN